LRGAEAEAPARAAVEHAVAEVASGRVDAAFLADVKANVRSTLVMQTDTAYRTGVWLVYHTALTGDPGWLDALMARVATVGPEELSAFARRWLVPAGRSTVAVARGKGGAR
jgi:zinc protease